MNRLLIAAILFLAPVLALAGENLSAEVLLPSHGATQARAPVMAYGKGIYLVVWQTDRSEQADIVGLRLDESGKPLDAKPFVISGAKDGQERPRIAFGKDLFLVTWQDIRPSAGSGQASGKDYDVYAARISAEGKVLDPEGIQVSGGAHNQATPVVCFDGTNFQLLWRDLRGGVDYEIYGGRLSPEGRLVDGSGVLLQKSFNAGFTTNTGIPGVWSNGRGDVIGSVRGAAGGGYKPFFVWPMREGKPTGAAQEPNKPVLRSPTRSLGMYVPTFASDGKSVLMTFSTYVVGRIKKGRAQSSAGAVLLLPADGKIPFGTPLVVPSGGTGWAGSIRNPSPAWDGKSYVVAWDVSHDDDRGIPPYDQVYVRRISADGKPGEKETLVAGEFASPAFFPAVACDGKGTTIIAYERHPKTGAVPIKIGFRMLRAK